jgi:hypothetical protein
MPGFKNSVELVQIIQTDPEQGEKLMNEAFDKGWTKYRNNEKWLEAMQRACLDEYCSRHDERGAQRIVRLTVDPVSRYGRIVKYQDHFGSWESAWPVIPLIDTPANRPIVDTDSFRIAYREGRFAECETWLNRLDTIGRYKNLSGLDLTKHLVILWREIDLAKEAWAQRAKPGTDR